MTDRKKDKHATTEGPAFIPASVQDLHCFTETNGVITSTMNDIPGYRVVKVLGAVYGLTVRSRNWAAGLGMVVKSIAGGELTWFTNMVSVLRVPLLMLRDWRNEEFQELTPTAALQRAQRRHQQACGRDAEPWRKCCHRAALRRRRPSRLLASMCVWDCRCDRESRSCRCGPSAACKDVMDEQRNAQKAAGVVSAQVTWGDHGRSEVWAGRVHRLGYKCLLKTLLHNPSALVMLPVPKRQVLQNDAPCEPH